MSTRSLTHIRGEDNVGVIVTIYRQMDGYPSGMGADLKALVEDTTLTNGFCPGDALPAKANGMECLAAYLVGNLKGSQIGNIYLYPPGSNDCDEEYTYTLYPIGNRVGMKVEKAGWNETGKMVGSRYVQLKKPIVHPPVTLFDGRAIDFDPENAKALDDAA